MTTPTQNYGSVSNGQTPQGYEEFFGGTLPCPSCRGSGRIPRESENELVALIPMRDKRLKPSKTKYYVLLAVVACLLLGGILVFFLYPRSVRIEEACSNLIPTTLYINTTDSVVKMGVTNVFNVSNANFYGITIDKIESQVFFDRKIMEDVTNKTRVYVAMRSEGQYVMRFNVTFSGEEGYIASFCASEARFGHTLLMPFQTTMYIHLMGRTEESTLTSYQHVKCSPDLVPSTTVTSHVITTTPHLQKRHPQR